MTIMSHFLLMCVFINVSRYIWMGKWNFGWWGAQRLNIYVIYTYYVLLIKVHFNFICDALFLILLVFFMSLHFLCLQFCSNNDIFFLFSHSHSPFSIPSTLLPKILNAQCHVFFVSVRVELKVEIVDKFFFDELKALTGLHDSKLEERCFCSISVLLYFMVLLLLDHHPLSLYVIKWKSKLRNVHSIRTTSYFVLLSAQVFFWKFFSSSVDMVCWALSTRKGRRRTHTCWMVMMLLITMKMWLTLLPCTFAVQGNRRKNVTTERRKVDAT